MRAIVKQPAQRPEVRDIGTGFEAIKSIIGGWFERAMSGPGVHVYCDEDGICKELPLNLVRPSDGSPIVGTIVAVGTDGEDDRDLTDRELTLWLATLTVTADATEPWVATALAEFDPMIHASDRPMYQRIAAKVGR